MHMAFTIRQLTKKGHIMVFFATFFDTFHYKKT